MARPPAAAVGFPLSATSRSTRSRSWLFGAVIVIIHDGAGLGYCCCCRCLFRSPDGQGTRERECAAVWETQRACQSADGAQVGHVVSSVDRSSFAHNENGNQVLGR